MTVFERIKIFILLLILSVISFVVIIINGRTFELKIKLNDNIKSISDIEISTGDENIIKIVDKKLKDKVLVLKIKSVNKGHAFVEVISEKHYSIDRFYVHGLGIITHNRILGKCSGDIIVPISILILILAVLSIELRHYIKNVRNNLYQYKNITYLAIIIFVESNVSSEIFAFLFTYSLWEALHGIIYVLSKVKDKRAAITQNLLMDVDFIDKDNVLKRN